MVKLGVTIQVQPHSRTRRNKTKKRSESEGIFWPTENKTVIFHSYITLLEGMAKTGLLYYITFDQ